MADILRLLMRARNPFHLPRTQVPWSQRKRVSSADLSRTRLQTVLAHDRAGISPAILDVLKEEIIAAISRHVDTQREAVEIGLDQDAQESRLIVTVPLRSINTRRKR